MEPKEELFVFASTEIETILAENQTSLADLLKREGYDVEKAVREDPASIDSEDKTREITTVLLASAAVIAALTPIVIQVIKSLTYNKDVVVHEKVLVPIEDSAGNVVRDASGEPLLKWEERSKILESTSGTTQNELKIKAFGFEIEIKNSVS